MTALSVLLVEDDAMIGIVLTEMLEDMGYAVCGVAATEDDAVTEAARCKPGLMIVDLHLQEGDGVSAMDRILKTGPMPCIFVSGTPEPVTRPNATVLMKPFAGRELIQAIHQLVRTEAAVPRLT